MQAFAREVESGILKLGRPARRMLAGEGEAGAGIFRLYERKRGVELLGSKGPRGEWLGQAGGVECSMIVSGKKEEWAEVCRRAKVHCEEEVGMREMFSVWKQYI